MAPKATTTTATGANTERSNAITVTPEDGKGNALLAAWQGVYNLFGGRAQFKMTDDGIIAEDFTVDAQYDPTAIVNDVSHRARRLDFLEVFPWFNGEAPDDFTDAKQMTQWTVQFLRGALEDNSSRAPKYVRDAVAAYKSANNFAKKRGPKKKIFRTDNLSEIDENTLSGINPDELRKLQETLAKALANAQANTTGDTTSAPAEVVTA